MTIRNTCPPTINKTLYLQVLCMAWFSLPCSTRTWGAPEPTALNFMWSLAHWRLGNILCHASRATLAEASSSCPFDQQDSSVKETKQTKKQHTTKFHSDNAQDDVLLPGWSAWYVLSTPAFKCSAPSTPWDFTAASLSKTLPNTILPFWVSVVWAAALFGSCSPCLTVFFNHRQCVVCAKQNMEMTAAVK